MAELFPEAFLTETDAVLDTFESALPGLGEARDEKVFAVVERVVLALNAVNDACEEAAFATDEREELPPHYKSTGSSEER